MRTWGKGENMGKFESIAEEILNEYASAYSQVELERLARMLKGIEKDTATDILSKVKSYTLDKEVGMRYLIAKLCKEYGVEV